MGDAGLLGSCTFKVVRVWLHLAVLLPHVDSLKERCAEMRVAGRRKVVTLRSVCQNLIGDVIAAFIPVC